MAGKMKQFYKPKIADDDDDDLKFCPQPAVLLSSLSVRGFFKIVNDTKNFKDCYRQGVSLSFSL
jgi:hypothetical protein